jgi:hypothetical protein
MDQKILKKKKYFNKNRIDTPIVKIKGINYESNYADLLNDWIRVRDRRK